MAGVDLIALCIEARRRQITYGQLIARTSEAEQKEIIAKYREVGKKKELKRGRAGEPAPLDMILSGTPGMTGAAQRTIYI